MLRKTSSTKGIDDLDVEHRYGDVFDDAALADAMSGCDVVYHCIVDARMWLRDPAPLFRTNVEGLRHVLDAAVAADLRKFVYTSTTGTLAVSTTRPVTEDDPHDWDDGGPYIKARVEAENLVLRYVREAGLPAVALCISTTYGPGDWQPTPHGGLIAQVAAGRFPFYLGFSAEVVGIEDAARAMLLAAEHGRVGERYIVSTATSVRARCTPSPRRRWDVAHRASDYRCRCCTGPPESTIWPPRCCGATSSSLRWGSAWPN